jgi:hypothetical protein
MPTLANPRYEAFAQARAKGMLLMDAYESAGFVRHRGHPSRLALRDEVAERIAELRAMQTEAEDVSLVGLLASLRRIIKAGEASENPTLVNAARLAIVDASRIQAELARMQSHERRYLDNEFKALSESKVIGAGPPEGEKQRPSTPPKLPAAAPPAPRGLPKIAPQTPRDLLASAAASPLARPASSLAPVLALRR